MQKDIELERRDLIKEKSLLGWVLVPNHNSGESGVLLSPEAQIELGVAPYPTESYDQWIWVGQLITTWTTTSWEIKTPLENAGQVIWTG